MTEAHLLTQIGRGKQAYKKLLRISDKVFSTSNILLLRDYHFRLAIAGDPIGMYEDAYNNCLKAIELNDKLSKNHSQL